MRILIALLVLAGTAHAAPTFGVILTSDTTNIRIELADLPGSKDRFLVTWDALPGATATGAMVFYKDQGQSEARYLAVGGGGPFVLVEDGRHTLIAGTLVPVFQLVQDDPDHPTPLVARSGKQLDQAAMLARYAAFEHLGAPGEPRPAIEAAIASAAAHAGKTCGARFTPQVQWAAFANAGKLALARQTVAILDALETLCREKDYRAAVQALTSVRVELRADPGALEIAATRGTLTIGLSDASFNPRETASRWLFNHL